MGSRDTYNRYSDFITNGKQTVVPYVDLPSKSADKIYIYKDLCIEFLTIKDKQMRACPNYK